MNLYYYKDSQGNFGDDLNPWLWGRLLPNTFDSSEDCYFVGIGTLINRGLNDLLPAQATKLIFGSGVGYGDLPTVDSTWKFYFVRGPLSAERLQIDSRFVITDGAILLRALPQETLHKTYPFAFMPHHKSAHQADWMKVCALAGIHYIHPEWDVDTVLTHLKQTEVLLTEAMHGAIVADALRVPWIPIAIYEHILPFKWQDWCSSLDLVYEPHQIDPLLDIPRSDLSAKTRVKKAIQGLLSGGVSPEYKRSAEQLKALCHAKPILSRESKIAEVTERSMVKLEELKRDIQNGLHLPAPPLLTTK
jgi:succinoglycan biosynthesis protein ExoV